MSEVTCEKCGAIYERTYEKLQMRDKDSFECGCGHTLEKWNSSSIPKFELIKEADKAK